MTYTYTAPTTGTHAKAVGRSLAISMKEAVVVSHQLRGKALADAKNMLKRVISMKEAMPYFRFYHNVGHRPGSMGPGRYPINTSKAILSVLESAEANAVSKGIAPEKLIISTIVAQKGSINWRFGRRRVRGKRTHVEVILTPTLKEKPTKRDRKAFAKKGKQASPLTIPNTPANPSTKKEAPA